MGTISKDESGLPRYRLWQPITAKWFAAVFGASLVYAIIRYHIAGDIVWTHFPLFIFNKAISLAAVVFVACAYLIGKIIRWHDDNKAMRLVVIKFCGLMGFFLAGIHALFSVILLTPAYFAKYFVDDSRLSFAGEAAMAAGVVGLFFLMAPAITTLPMMPQAIGSQRWKRSQRAGYIALALVVVHLIALGWKGWLTPNEWQAGMPPISLLAAIGALTPFIVRRQPSKKRKNAKTSE